MADRPADHHGALGSPGGFLAAVREWQLWVVVGSVVVLLAPALVGGRTLFFRDLYRQYIGTARLLSGSQHMGWLWDPLLHGGEPLLGNPNRALLYPSRLLYLVLDPVTALNWEIALHLALAAAAAYLAARLLGLRREPAMIVGAVYAFAGVPLSLTNHLLRVLAYPWMAVAFIAGHRWRAEPVRTGWFAVLVAALMVQGLTGTVETALCSLMLVMAWQLAGPERLSIRCRHALKVAGASLLGVAAAGIQVVPAAATVARSMRPVTADANFLLAWSVHPARLLELWFPGLFGPVDTATPATSYWGAPLVDFGFPYLLSLYVGLATTALVVCALVERSDRPLTRNRRWTLALVVALGVVASLGRHVPGMAGVVEALGPLAVVRFPVKALLLAALPAAVLAGCGVQYVVTDRPRAVRAVAGWAAGLSAASLLLWLVVTLCGGCRRWLLELLFLRADATVTAGVARSLLHGAITAGALALIVVLARRMQARSLGLALAAIVAVDLMFAGRAVLPTAPRALLADEPQLTDVLRSHLGAGRLYRDLDPAVVHPRLAANTAAAAAAWWIAVLDRALAANYGIPMVFHDDDAMVADRRIVRLTESVQRAPWRRRLAPLSAAGVSLVMTADDPPIEGLEHVVDVVTGVDPEYHLYRNPGAGEGPWWVGREIVVSSAGEALARVTGGAFDPRQEVVLERDLESIPEPAWLPTWAALEQRIDEVDVTAPAAGHVVFPEVWMPGLRVEVDGRVAPLLRANYAFAAVTVDGGRHRIRRVYRPPEVTLGLWLTTAALCVAVVVVGVSAGSTASRRPRRDRIRNTGTEN